MGSTKRQRQRENRLARIAEEERARQSQKKRGWVLKVVLIVAGLLLAAFIYSRVTGGGDDLQVIAGDDASETITPAAPTAPAGETEQPATTLAPTTTLPTATTAAPSSSSSIPANCPAFDGSARRRFRFDEPPPICVEPNQYYAVDFETTAGDFTMVLDPQLDPASVNNFVVLTAHHAYDGTIFHRVIDGFVVQGGDVEQRDGTGGPGYRFTGGEPETGWYREGAVAMANSGDASSNGSQFFVITGPSGATLPTLYSPLGFITSGYDVVETIEAVEVDGGDKPLEDVVVNVATLREATDGEVADFEAAFAN